MRHQPAQRDDLGAKRTEALDEDDDVDEQAGRGGLSAIADLFPHAPTEDEQPIQIRPKLASRAGCSGSSKSQTAVRNCRSG